MRFHPRESAARQGGRDHGGIIGGKPGCGEAHRQATALAFLREPAAQFAIGRDTARNQDAARAERLGGGKGLAQQIAHDGGLEGRDQAKGLGIEMTRGMLSGDARERGAASLDGPGHGVRLHVAQHGGS